MSDEITPALTPDEWSVVLHNAMPVAGIDSEIAAAIEDVKRAKADCIEPGRVCHATAALCLHKHPNGFTQDDVDDLRWIATDYLVPGTSPSVRMLNMANRLAALLPNKEADGQ